MSVKLYDYLNFKSLNIEVESNDPGNDDIEFLLEVASEIPKNLLDLDDINPELLATRCLSAVFTSSKLYAFSKLWHGLKERELFGILGKLLSESEEPVTIKKDIAKSNEQ